jgi:hypothetical protein
MVIGLSLAANVPSNAETLHGRVVNEDASPAGGATVLVDADGFAPKCLA